MTDALRRMLRRLAQNQRPPTLSSGSWDAFPDETPRVVQICHPDWRGVRTVAYAFRSPVIECDDLETWGEQLVGQIRAALVDGVILQGWPPGSGQFVRRLRANGVRVKCVMHSSPAQHGAEAGEAAVIDEILELAREGVLDGLGLAKAGVPEAFRAAGFPVTHVPNRVPLIPEVVRQDLGAGLNIGVFAEPFWRKNVTTQLLAVGLMGGARAHVMRRPDNRYLDGLEILEHGELPYEEFVSLQGSVDLNLYVTLSECHPSTPQESYLYGVPCLISRVSSVFKADPVLWDLTSVDEADNPRAIADGSLRLLANREEAVERATEWMRVQDQLASEIWAEFIAG